MLGTAKLKCPVENSDGDAGGKLGHYPVQAALDEGECRFDGVGVDFALHVNLCAVVDGFVP